MRAIAFLIAALALSACVQREGPARPQGLKDACAHTAAHSLTWSSPTDKDTVSASSEGPTCAQAVVTLVVRNIHGDPLWTFARSYYELRTGGTRAPGVAPAPVTAADMEAFLQSLAQVTTMGSAELPDWAEGKPAPQDASRPFKYVTAYSRQSYESLRAANRALICYAAAAETTQCLIMDPASNAPAVIVAFGP
jgi:hypothetical protein